MFTQINPIAPLSNAPLATNANIISMMNRQTLPTSGEYRKVFVGKIPPGLSDAFVLKLLEVTINCFYSFFFLFNHLINSIGFNW